MGSKHRRLNTALLLHKNFLYFVSLTKINKLTLIHQLFIILIALLNRVCNYSFIIISKIIIIVLYLSISKFNNDNNYRQSIISLIHSNLNCLTELFNCLTHFSLCKTNQFNISIIKIKPREIY